MSNKVIIGLGQSNMVGANWKDGSGNVYASWYQPSYTNAAKIYYKQQGWTGGAPYDLSNPGGPSFAQISTDPVHAPSSAPNVGPMMAMADKMLTTANDPNLKIGVLPGGWSGTFIDDAVYQSGAFAYSWARQFHAGMPFGQLVARIKSAKAWGTIDSAVISLGESDAGLPYTACNIPVWPRWNNGVYQLIEGIRTAAGNDDLPILFVQLGPNPNAGQTSWAQIQTWIGVMAGMPNIAVVTASDTTCVDAPPVHRSVGAQVTLGHQLADARAAM